MKLWFKLLYGWGKKKKKKRLFKFKKTLCHRELALRGERDRQYNAARETRYQLLDSGAEALFFLTTFTPVSVTFTM